LLAIFGKPWSEDDTYARAHEFISEYVDNWQAHQALFRVRNLASEEGLPGFAETRVNAISPLINQMAVRIGERQASGELPAQLDPTACAGALLAMIERAAVAPLDMPSYSTRRPKLYDAAGFFVALIMGGANIALRIYGLRPNHGGKIHPTEQEGPKPNGHDDSHPPTGKQDESHLNLDGQVMGEKGIRTRLRLMQSAEAFLRTKSIMDLSVADISRAAGTSPSAFYRYFRDVPDVILAILEGVPQSAPHLLDLLRDWDGGGIERGRQFTRGYMDLWQAHAALFRVRNLAADEGDVRFGLARAKSLQQILGLIEEGVRTCQSKGAFPEQLDPLPTAGVFLGMLERLSVAPNVLRAPEMTLNGIAGAAAYILQVLMVGAQNAQDDSCGLLRR
jgi:AcrR family transcriptional regulator